jgi:hypothetical protein
MFDLPVVAPGVAIFEHLRRHADEAGRTPDELRLPDDDKGRHWHGWAPGAWDRSSRRRDRASDTGRARQVAGLLSSACRHPSVTNLRALYAGVVGDSLIGYVDVLTELLTREQPERRALHPIGHWLATTAPDREPAKLGATLLGVAGSDADLPVLRLLGAHSEFTLFCVTAMANILPGPEPELWALARSLEGEGRVVCVELLRDTEDPSIREWILRGGFRNLNGSHQLALVAATTGDLLSALRGDVDRELLTAAGEIIQGLFLCDDLDGYEHGAHAVEAFLGHMRTRADTVQDVSTVAEIGSYLADDGHGEGFWEETDRRHWTATRRAAFTETCGWVLSWDKWPERITAGLAGTDDGPAIWAARALGIDVFDTLVEKIRANPRTSTWYDAWLWADTERAGRLVDMATTLLPIDQIATGPADEQGLGPAWQTHRAFGWTVQALRDHPGTGGDLLLAGLRSPLNLDRYMALNALRTWPNRTWPPGAAAAVEEAARTDPNKDVRQFAARLADGPPAQATWP